MPVAFVTGAAQGIGRGIAVRLAQDGFDVVVNDIPSKDLSPVMQEIKAKGRKALAAPADVSSATAVEEAVQKTVAELGGLDVMVANAGILISGAFLETSSEELDRILSVNVKGVFNCFQAGAKQMIKQGHGGRLIAASSVAGKLGMPNTSVYCASKFAIRGLVQAVATEMGKHGITSNCYCPTAIETAMIRDPKTGQLRDEVKMVSQMQPIPRLGKVEDVANVVSFLASEQGGFITGQSWNVDGGLNPG